MEIDGVNPNLNSKEGIEAYKKAREESRKEAHKNSEIFVKGISDALEKLPEDVLQGVDAILDVRRDKQEEVAKVLIDVFLTPDENAVEREVERKNKQSERYKKYFGK